MSISRLGGARGLERLACSKYYYVGKTFYRQMCSRTFFGRNSISNNSHLKFCLMQYVILTVLSPKLNVIYCFPPE